VDKQPAIPEMR